MSSVEKSRTRREFFRNTAVGAVGAAVALSLSCGNNETTDDTAEQASKSGAMTREQYLEYVDHFNNKRYDAVTSYFAPDITVEYYDSATGPQDQKPRTLYGPQAFIDSYKQLHESVKEVLELGDFLSTEQRVFAELYTEFHTFKDSPASEGRPGRVKGTVSVMTNWVMYDMKDGKMTRIRIAHFRNHDPAQAKYKG